MRIAPVVFVLLASAAFSQTRGGVGEYALILSDPPVAAKVASRAELRGATAQAHLKRVVSAQAAVKAELARRKTPALGASQIVLNAVFVEATPETAAQLRAIPGVLGVVYMPPLKPDLNTAINLINAPAAWSLISGGTANAGAGIKIGIIDSGIDQNHPAFQDASLTPLTGFPNNNTAYTNNKVIVARNYVSQTPYPDPNSVNSLPDDTSPADRNGHGTALAMIAAGVQNTGPLATIQGVAPKAYLGNYKVFGSPGVNDDAVWFNAGVIQAFDDAITDGMDIVTLAMNEGDPAWYGPTDVDASSCANPGPICDPLAYAVEQMVNKGMVVVAAAGNDGNAGINFPTLNTIHTPGTAPHAITVGATTNSHALYNAVHALGASAPAALQTVEALFSTGPQPQQAITAPIVDVTQTGNNGLACTSLPAGSMAGAIALAQRGTCDFSDKITYAQNAGAIAVILYQPSGQETPFAAAADDTGIPAMGIGYSDGLELKFWADANPGVSVTLDPAISAYSSQADVVADFSSRGPAISTFGLKPELVAPGVNIYTATQKIDPNSPMYHASGYTLASGTSFSVAMAAGAAALVKQKLEQANLPLTPAQIAAAVKSALVNTATQNVTDTNGGQPPLSAVGGGELNAANALGATLSFDPAALSFGNVTAGALPSVISFTVTNTGSAAQTVGFSVNQLVADSRAAVTLTPTSVTLQPGGSVSVQAKLAGSLPVAAAYDGYIVATSGSSTYRVPYQYLVATGVAANVFPIADGVFVGQVYDTGWPLALRAVDSSGVPVQNASLLYTSLTSGGAITAVDPSTLLYGIGGALVNLGGAIGEYDFQGTAGGLSYVFTGYALGMITVPPNSVVEAATSQIPPGFAPGSYISIYGSNLSPASQAVSTAELPYSLSTTSVSFFAANGRFPGRLEFVGPGQLNVQIPWELQGQTSAQFVVNIGFTSLYPAVTIPLARSSPGVFTNGAAIEDENNLLVTAANPAKRGPSHAIQIFMNGLGPVNAQPPTGEPTPYPVQTSDGLVHTLDTPTVTIGGVPATVSFSGLTPYWVGLYQINASLPANTPTGSQDLIVSIGGATSIATKISVQ
jgi:uncharacterized protein (TIGR03437 family)